MKYTLFFLLIFTLNLVPFQNARAWEYKPLEQECLDLSKATGTEYKFIMGKVIKSYPVEKNSDSLHTKMLPLNETSAEKSFLVYFSFGNSMDLADKESYMAINKKYEFCARGPELTGPNRDQITYYIDDIEAVRPISDN